MHSSAFKYRSSVYIPGVGLTELVDMGLVICGKDTTALKVAAERFFESQLFRNLQIDGDGA